MRVRIVKEFGGYRAGQLFDWGDGMARVLVARGLVQPVDDGEVEVAAVESKVERATQPQPRRKSK